jgi:iron complex transport system ATP-binding protein
MKTFFQLDRVTAGYGNEFHIQDISVDIQKGSFTGIIGPNGSGKTTLFKAIMGDLPVKAGNTILNGKNIQRLNQKERARNLAIVRQIPNMAAVRVADYVLMGRYPYHRPFQFFETKKDVEVSEKYMELTSVGHLKNKLINNLSGGELQLVSLARALSQEPELLLLDEPTAHLDIKHQVKIMNLIQKLNESLGLTVMMIIHDLNLASEYCGHLILMKEGKLIAKGTPEQVLTYKNIEDVYETIVVTQKNPVSGKPAVMLVSANSLTKMKHERSFIGKISPGFGRS